MEPKHDVADDITQDTFIRAFRSLTSFRSESTIKTWLLKIARDACINHKKSAFIRKMVLIDFIQDTKSAPSAELDYFNTQFTNQVWEIVFKLSLKKREVIVLDAYYEMPIASIAEFLAVPVGTVKSRVRRYGLWQIQNGIVS
ncbi:RNA polymerase sigma factor [Paenibacillus sp. PL2-23]|uniref:RNA polymerase sigma factor n=1 Tax=Paenibacillus sp. PL2-23 TaxID=2100729 RepID=UPI0030F86C16